MSYIVSNCPAYLIEEDYCTCYLEVCSDCADCVVKQVIEKCKYCYNAEQKSRYKTNGYMLADTILQLFGIQEINK